MFSRTWLTLRGIAWLIYIPRHAHRCKVYTQVQEDVCLGQSCLHLHESPITGISVVLSPGMETAPREVSSSQFPCERMKIDGEDLWTMLLECAQTCNSQLACRSLKRWYPFQWSSHPQAIRISSTGGTLHPGHLSWGWPHHVFLRLQTQLHSYNEENWLLANFCLAGFAWFIPLSLKFFTS